MSSHFIKGDKLCMFCVNTPPLLPYLSVCFVQLKKQDKHHNPPKQQKQNHPQTPAVDMTKSKNCQGRKRLRKGDMPRKQVFLFSSHLTSGKPGLILKGCNKIPKPIQKRFGSSRGQLEHRVPPSPNPVLPFHCL